MKKVENRGFKAVLLTITFALLFNATVCAASFSDVPENHWAYSAISKMADLGFMVGDSSGKYSPNQVIDKFYAAKAMAKVGGYKAVGYTAAEKTFQDNAYEANKSTLNMFKNNFKKWDSTADREIAYLLERKVLTVEDLNRFVLVQLDGSEIVRPLVKEEAAVFLVKLMGKQQDALSQTQPLGAFSDDAQISAQAKPFVYYMKQIGLVSGDTANKFNPAQSVTKAVFAVMLNGAYGAMSGGAQAQPSGAANTIESVSGVIVETYAQRNALQIENSVGKKSINNLALGTSITVDGFVSTIYDLKSGMGFTAVLVNDELTSLKAVTTPVASTPVSTAPASSPTNAQTIEGTVSSVVSDAVARTISLDVRMLNSVGTVYNETRTFGLSSGCTVTRGGRAVPFADIAIGDIVSAKVSGNSAYAIEAREAQMNFSGILLERRSNTVSNTNYYVIEDMDGKSYDLIINEQAQIERAPSEYGLKWTDLKLGDRVDVKTNYNVISYIRGEGVRTNVEGFVKEMHIYEDDRATILFMESATNETKEYAASSSVVDVYSMRIGDKLRLRLDSWEIDSYTKLENSATQNVSGKITSVKNQTFAVTPYDSNKTVTVAFDANTYVYDAIARKSVSASSLMQNMEVFVTYRQGPSNYASSVTILNK